MRPTSAASIVEVGRVRALTFRDVGRQIGQLRVAVFPDESRDAIAADAPAARAFEHSP